MARRAQLESTLSLRYSRTRGNFAELTVPLEGGWKVIYTIVRAHDRAVFSEARIVAADDAELPEGGISAELLHGIKVGEHRSRIARHLEGFQKLGGDARLERHGLARLSAPPQLADGRRDELWWAQLAELYVQLLRAGVSRPVPAIATRLGLADTTVTAALRDARGKYGLLTKAPPGRAGGRLTKKAERILARHQQKGGK